MSKNGGAEYSILHFLGLCALGFLVLASYSLARPPAESLFLDTFGRDGLPGVWVAVAGVAFVTVGIYNRFATTVPLTRLFIGVCVVSVGTLILLLLAKSLWPAPAVFLLYVWKDLYIVFLVEIFWTYANNVFPLRSARWLYGSFLLAGTLGSFTGNIAVGQFANRLGLGTAATMWLVVPTLLTAALGFFWIGRSANLRWQRLPRPASLLDSFAVLRNNRYLVLMVALICIAQVVVTLVDYQFSGVILREYPDTDARTEVIGLVYGSINVSALALQIVTGPVLRLIGVGPTLVAIPMLLGATLVAWLVQPRAAAMIVAKVASKAFDYSIYRAAKELLYLPLSYRERIQGKAMVDILGYRFAKAATSVLLLGLIALEAQSLVTVLSLVAIAVWVGITLALVRRYRMLVPAEEAQPAVVTTALRTHLLGMLAGACGGALIGLFASGIVCGDGAGGLGVLTGSCNLWGPLWLAGGAGAIIGAVEGVIVQRGLDEARR